MDAYRDAANTLAFLVGHGGHDARVAYTRLAALEAAAAFRPDVVLMEVSLPDLEGLEVARRLRSLPGPPEPARAPPPCLRGGEAKAGTRQLFSPEGWPLGQPGLECLWLLFIPDAFLFPRISLRIWRTSSVRSRTSFPVLVCAEMSIKTAVLC